MRKTLCVLSLAAAAAFSAPASAQPANYYYSGPGYAGPVVAGAAVGTVVGVGLHNGWWGGTAFPTTAAGAAVAGGIAGVGTAALIDAAVQPCQGFRALFNNFLARSSGECAGGRYVGYAPRR